MVIMLDYAIVGRLEGLPPGRSCGGTGLLKSYGKPYFRPSYFCSGMARWSRYSGPERHPRGADSSRWSEWQVFFGGARQKKLHRLL